MKILHVWEIAGVGNSHAKYQREQGHNSIVIQREAFDLHGITKDMKNIRVGLGRGAIGKYWFILRVMLKLFWFRPKVVHVHSWLKGLMIMDYWCRGFRINPKFVYTSHGSDIRDFEKNYGVTFDQKKFPMVSKWICVTEDLEKYFWDVEWLLNPIEVPDLDTTKIQGKAVFVRCYPIDKLYQAEQIALRHNLDLEIIDRWGGNKGVPFMDLMRKLSKAEFYFDMKGYNVGGQLSKTGYEALALNCTVIDDDNQNHLPRTYLLNSQNKTVYARMIQIYESKCHVCGKLFSVLDNDDWCKKCADEHDKDMETSCHLCPEQFDTVSQLIAHLEEDDLH